MNQNDDNNICEFCLKSFFSKYTLSNHQKKTKKCLELQNEKIALEKKNEQNLVNEIIKEYEQKITNIQKNHEQYISNLQRNHEQQISNLQKNHEQQLSDMKKDFDNLKNKYEEKVKDYNILIETSLTHSKPNVYYNNKTQINNYINNLDLVTDDIIQENANKLTIEHIKKGPEGYADYVVNNPLKNRIICTDLSRKKIKYKNEKGDIISDPNFLNLSKRIFSSMNDINEKLISEYREQLEELYPEIEDRIEVFKQLIDCSMLTKEGYNEDTKEIYNEFVKSICLKTIPQNFC